MAGLSPFKFQVLIAILLIESCLSLVSNYLSNKLLLKTLKPQVLNHLIQNEERHTIKNKYNQIRIQHTRLYEGYRAWWDDDLPNLFGINPIEAAVIFGFFYWLYGPDALYSYAREAGKLFSTYAPIVKDLAVNIYNEFKEYIDEDRQRDEMAKRGIDVSMIPRRTTNVIERVQESLAMLSEMTDTSKSGAGSSLSDDLQGGIKPELFVDTDIRNSNMDERPKKRKTKKKILESKNINVDKLIEIEDTKYDNNRLVEAEITNSLNLVQERITTLTEVRKNEIDDKGLFSSSSTGYSTSATTASSSSISSGMINSGTNDDILMKTPFMSDYEFPPADSMTSPLMTPSPATPPMSKFQQQMSGMWNQQVLEREKASALTGGMGMGTPYGSVPPTPTDWDWEDPMNLQANLPQNPFEDDTIYDRIPFEPTTSTSTTATTTTADPTTDTGNTILPTETNTSVSKEVSYNEYGIPMDLDMPSIPEPVTVSPIEVAVSTDLLAEVIEVGTLSAITSATTLQASTVTPVSTNTTTDKNSTMSSSSEKVIVNENMMSILTELDRDYQALRQRLMTAILTIETNKENTPAAVYDTVSHSNENHINNSVVSESSSDSQNQSVTARTTQSTTETINVTKTPNNTNSDSIIL